MAENDLLKRSLEAGLNFTHITRERAKELVQELVKEGKLSSEQASKAAEELINWSKKTTESIRNMVSTELKKQIDALGLVRRTEIQKILEKLPITKSSKTVTRNKASSTTKSAKSAPKKSAKKVAKKKA
jgi:polyhydroxyalkanoate synthesis regulator phasin